MLSRMPITRAEKPHWGAPRFPFMNSMTRFFSTREAMRSRVCSDRLIRTPSLLRRAGLRPQDNGERVACQSVGGRAEPALAHTRGQGRGEDDESDPRDR